MKSLEHQAKENGGYLKVDLDEREGAFEWCIIMVTPALVEKLAEIAKRTGEAPDTVLVKAVLKYDAETKKEKDNVREEVRPAVRG
jgi:hypothetical protein